MKYAFFHCFGAFPGGGFGQHIRRASWWAGHANLRSRDAYFTPYSEGVGQGSRSQDTAISQGASFKTHLVGGVTAVVSRELQPCSSDPGVVMKHNFGSSLDAPLELSAESQALLLDSLRPNSGSIPEWRALQLPFLTRGRRVVP